MLEGSPAWVVTSWGCLWSLAAKLARSYGGFLRIFTGRDSDAEPRNRWNTPFAGRKQWG